MGSGCVVGCVIHVDGVAGRLVERLGVDRRRVGIRRCRELGVRALVLGALVGGAMVVGALVGRQLVVGALVGRGLDVRALVVGALVGGALVRGQLELTG